MSRKKKKEKPIRTKEMIISEIESNKIRIDNLIIVNQIESVWQLLDRYIDLKVEIIKIEMEENENKNIYA